MYQLLESTRDEHGNWRITLTEILHTPAWLIDDLLALKSFGSRFESQLEKKRAQQKQKP